MIVGRERLESKLDGIGNMEVETAVRKSTMLVNEAAKNGCPVNDGELRESIYHDVQQDADIVRGVCYTNKKHGPYVELGTGPKGQANHSGISPEVTPAYSQSPWWIHESQIDQAVAERYHWFKIETKDGVFYQCSGQAAQPFMYPALKNNVDNIKELMAKELKSQIGKAIK